MTETIETLRSHRTIREFKDAVPEKETIKKIVRAAQQAPFASQAYSVIMEKDPENAPYGAPLLFTVNIDAYRMELIMEKRGWETEMNDLLLLLLGSQDASLMTQNMITAAESLNLGTCLLGNTPYRAENIAEKYELPKRVFPLVQLVIGYPDEDPPIRPRYPLEFTFFEDKYPTVTGEMTKKAMSVMDKGFLKENYYKGRRIELEEGEGEIDEKNYSWTEHISRKWGLWGKDIEPLIEILQKRGFDITL